MPPFGNISETGSSITCWARGQPEAGPSPWRPLRSFDTGTLPLGGAYLLKRLPLHAESFMLRRRSALLAAAMLPVVAGGFLYQNRATTDGARVLDQVLQLVSHALRRHRQPGRPLREGGARPREGAQRSVQRAVLAEGARELLAADQRQVRRHRHADRGSAGRDHDQQGLPAHAGGSAPACARATSIVFVDTLSTRGWKTQQVSDYLIGEPGTKVTVKFEPAGRPRASSRAPSRGR